MSECKPQNDFVKAPYFGPPFFDKNGGSAGGGEFSPGLWICQAPPYFGPRKPYFVLSAPYFILANAVHHSVKTVLRSEIRL